MATVLKLFVIIAAAPLVSGSIRKIKNTIRMRQGQGLLQPYYNLIKLFSKEEVISQTASWIFRAAPAVVFISAAAAALLVPVVIPRSSFSNMGDVLVLMFLLAVGRFFLALAGLDTGSAFGGMGSSREMFLSSLAEPAAFVAVFAAAVPAGSTSLTDIAGLQSIRVSSVIAAVSLFMVIIAETSRVPVDNQETHLELTMVHEAMLLEYSGRSLALLELASHIKQLVLFTLAADILIPPGLFMKGGITGCVLAGVVYALQVAGIGALIAGVEVSVAKMRLFRVVDFLLFAFIIALVALIAAVLGF